MTKLGEVLSRVRPEVREQRPYKVGVPTGDIAVKLNQNESPFDLPEELKVAVFAGWREIAFNRYPAEQPDDLAELIASNIGWDPEGIIIGNGSNELTYALGMTFIAAGSRVVLPRQDHVRPVQEDHGQSSRLDRFYRREPPIHTALRGYQYLRDRKPAFSLL